MDTHNIKLNVNEIFGPTIQGEGLFVGRPSFFVRLNYCNLRCVFRGGSMCDTSYTSHNPESSKYTNVGEVFDEYRRLKNEYLNVNHVVITGGEPMLQQNGLGELVELIYQSYPDTTFTIETNGTIPLKNGVLKKRVLLWSLSPKLSNSGCFENTNIPENIRNIHNSTRINIDAINSYICDIDDDNGTLVQLKFVYSVEDGNSIESQIEDILSKLKYQSENVSLLIYLMPEGEVEEQIKRNAEEAIRACFNHFGWSYCDRLHIRIWGNKRGV